MTNVESQRSARLIWWTASMQLRVTRPATYRIPQKDECNLYSMTATREAILRLFRISENRATAFVPKDAIVPGHEAPVVRYAADGARELVQMSWGFVLPQPGKGAASDNEHEGRQGAIEFVLA